MGRSLTLRLAFDVGLSLHFLIIQHHSVPYHYCSIHFVHWLIHCVLQERQNSNDAHMRKINKWNYEIDQGLHDVVGQTWRTFTLFTIADARRAKSSWFRHLDIYHCGRHILWSHSFIHPDYTCVSFHDIHTEERKISMSERTSPENKRKYETLSLEKIEKNLFKEWKLCSAKLRYGAFIHFIHFTEEKKKSTRTSVPMANR